MRTLRVYVRYYVIRKGRFDPLFEKRPVNWQPGNTCLCRNAVSWIYRHYLSASVPLDRLSCLFFIEDDQYATYFFWHKTLHQSVNSSSSSLLGGLSYSGLSNAYQPLPSTTTRHGRKQHRRFFAAAKSIGAAAILGSCQVPQHTLTVPDVNQLINGALAKGKDPKLRIGGESLTTTSCCRGEGTPATVGCCGGSSLTPTSCSGAGVTPTTAGWLYPASWMYPAWLFVSCVQ